jgi:hypothetical protein
MIDLRSSEKRRLQQILFPDAREQPRPRGRIDRQIPAALGPCFSDEVKLPQDFFSPKDLIERKHDLPFIDGVWIAAPMSQIRVAEAHPVRRLLPQRELKRPKASLLKAFLGELESHEIGITIDPGQVLDNLIAGVPGAKKPLINPAAAQGTPWLRTDDADTESFAGVVAGTRQMLVKQRPAFMAMRGCLVHRGSAPVAKPLCIVVVVHVNSLMLPDGGTSCGPQRSGISTL